MKLSPSQKELLAALRDGWTLHRNRWGMLHVEAPAGVVRMYYKPTESTVGALSRRELIKQVDDESNSRRRRYVLTDAGLAEAGGKP